MLTNPAAQPDLSSLKTSESGLGASARIDALRPSAFPPVPLRECASCSILRANSSRPTHPHLSV